MPGPAKAVAVGGRRTRRPKATRVENVPQPRSAHAGAMAAKAAAVRGDQTGGWSPGRRGVVDSGRRSGPPGRGWLGGRRRIPASLGCRNNRGHGQIKGVDRPGLDRRFPRPAPTRALKASRQLAGAATRLTGAAGAGEPGDRRPRGLPRAEGLSIWSSPSRTQHDAFSERRAWSPQTPGPLIGERVMQREHNPG